MDKFEEVKNILEEVWEIGYKTRDQNKKATSLNPKAKEHFSCQICQLFQEPEFSPESDWHAKNSVCDIPASDEGWKGTVMPLEYSVLDNFHVKRLPDKDILLALSSQAELSYKAGYETGKKDGYELGFHRAMAGSCEKEFEQAGIKKLIKQFLKDNNLEGKE